MERRQPLGMAEWSSLRDEFLGDTSKTYLDTATKGIPPRASLGAMQECYATLRRQESRSATEQTIAMLDDLQAARREAAAFINASEDEIALVESTQQGLRIIADALHFPPGSQVVTSDVEFLATVMPWRSLAESGVRLEVLPGCDGAISLEALEASLSTRTKAVCVSATQEVSGATLDLAALGRICRSHGVLSIVDATQYLGARTLDMERVEIDCIAVGGSKWLCNPFGLGFL
ncbi:MAG: aminotransferase class V-fold PLP-dependent enzyme, partial [Acidimicrobiales bacterium]